MKTKKEDVAAPRAHSTEDEESTDNEEVDADEESADDGDESANSITEATAQQVQPVMAKKASASVAIDSQFKR